MTRWVKNMNASDVMAFYLGMIDGISVTVIVYCLFKNRERLDTEYTKALVESYKAETELHRRRMDAMSKELNECYVRIANATEALKVSHDK